MSCFHVAVGWASPGEGRAVVVDGRRRPAKTVREGWAVWALGQDAATPTDPFMTSVNGLADGIDEGRCDAFDDTDCADPALMESRNRSTVYDGHRMLYQLYKLDGLTPEQLSDVYVDMCPRFWRERDGDCSEDADLPLKRWEASGYHHWLGVPVQDRLNRVEH